MAKNLLIVISGPSGAGKSTLSEMLTKEEGFTGSISCTTRNKRDGEIDGKHYFFVTLEEFLKKIQNEELLEYSRHFDNYYGTPKKYVLDCLKKENVVLEIDVNGGLQVKEVYGEALLIMIVAPNKEELEKRLRGRHSETDENIKIRLARYDYEVSKAAEYDYVLVNDDLNETYAKLKEIINKEINGGVENVK